ncbi:hypothetical protein BH11MYX4_BH11MYX4_61190 [soil metagenome]
MNWTKRLGKWLVVSAVVGGTCVSVGCLTRPVGKQPPTTKVNFTSTVSQQQVDKVDLLFMIDNSASMGDKQQILSEAVPNLLVGLLQPKCVDPNGAQVGGKTADPNGNKGNNFNCPSGSEPEFRPVTDMHIGIISSSLGSFGGDVCPDSGRSNDKAHLLNLTAAGPLADAGDSHFLSWFPTNEENKDAKRHPTPPTPAITDLKKLSDDFVALVTGVAQNGCGLEAQLESVYRFLIQPDPWVTVKLDGANQADLGAPNEIDVELLKQRADFLREDSLVAIIELTDEDDSSSDPLSVGGQGWAFMANQFPGSTVFRADGKTTTAPRATSICAQNPAADGKDGKVACTSCGFAATCNAGDPACQLIKNDSECQKNGGYYGPAEDQLNVRFHRMKERYGIDPQYPIKRYIDGLTKFRVPDRSAEHTTKARAGGGRDISGYVGTAKCTNPLFAKSLPRESGQEICTLQRSTRGPDLIFFAVVGGVPNNLLHFDPASPEKSRIVNDDWNKILGRDPANFNYEGIDPHMIQSVAPRNGVPPASDTRGDNGDANDPVGRDWKTGDDDLQYACTFKLPKERNCVATDPSCDCAGTKNPPLCGAAVGNQIKAKAYPTTREFQVVRALGDQGVIASLCPISLTVDKADPTYGYNPAVKSIIDRLKNALTTQCLPQKLTKSSDPTEKDQVPCLVLAQLGEVTDTCAGVGLDVPPAEILAKFLEQKKAESGDLKDGGTDLTKFPVCVLKQLVVATGDTCKDNADKGWCYVENGSGKTPAGKCPQALIFSSSTAALAGAQFSLQCIQQFSEEAGAGTP